MLVPIGPTVAPGETEMGSIFRLGVCDPQPDANATTTASALIATRSRRTPPP